MKHKTNETVDPVGLMSASREQYGEKYQDHLLDQYKIYLELTDRVSARRSLANSFFMGIHSALIAAFAILAKGKILPASLLGAAPLAIGLILCYVWWRILRSYKRLNSGRFRVIGEFERHLPAAPYGYEWELLGRGQSRKLYQPMTSIEFWVPACFALLHVSLGVVLFLAKFAAVGQ